MAESYFNLMKFEATDDLLTIFEFEEGLHYFTAITQNGTRYFRIILDTIETQEFYKLLKDLDIFMPHIGIYLSDFILLKKVPTKEIRELINLFSVDQLFSAFIHTPRLIKMKKNINKGLAV